MNRMNLMCVAIVSIVLLYTKGSDCDTTRVKDFFGVNTNVACYDKDYISEISDVCTWIREYHNWAHYEAADNYYKWGDITQEPQGWTWPHHTSFVEQCADSGINILCDVLDKPPWLDDSSPIPKDIGSAGSSVQDYSDRLEFVGQLVARYGSTVIDSSLIETPDKKSGLGYIKYYEDDNEPNYWWDTPRWSPEDYAVYLSGVHNGLDGADSSVYPLTGIKPVDSEAVHVMAGVAGMDTAYVDSVSDALGGQLLCDVINMHIYCTDQSVSYPPEHIEYGLVEPVKRVVEWRDRKYPGKALWITEYGWDTFSDSEGLGSYIYTTEKNQADYLLRSTLLMMEAGIDKGFMFMAADTDSGNTTQYASSGFLRGEKEGFEKKISYYYLSCMQRSIGEYTYSETIESGGAETEIYNLRFENQDAYFQGVYAVWCRDKGTRTNTGANVSDYEFKVPSSDSVVALNPVDGSLSGEYSSVEYEKTGDSTMVTLSVITETPCFVFVRGSEADIDHKRGPERAASLFKGLSVSSAGDNRGISITSERDVTNKIEIKIFTLNGKQICSIKRQRLFSGSNTVEFKNVELCAGMYLVTLSIRENRMSEIICFAE